MQGLRETGADGKAPTSKLWQIFPSHLLPFLLTILISTVKP